MKGNFHVRFGERGGETRWLQNQKVRSSPTLRTGLHTSYLREHYQVEGLDLDARMLEAARQKCHELTVQFAPLLEAAKFALPSFLQCHRMGAGWLTDSLATVVQSARIL